MKKIMPGTSDGWSMSRSSHRPNNQAYYIEDCRIFGDAVDKRDFLYIKLDKSLALCTVLHRKYFDSS